MKFTEEMLLEICNKLQLQASLYKLAEERYNVISKIIQKDPTFHNVELRMYPQGSFRLKTTVKPLVGNEYDLDFVIEIPICMDMNPRELYDHIFRILSEDGVHDKMIEKKSRCIRVNYANDFHLDIMPGKKVDNETNEIIVPDRELKVWYHHSNPIGYAEWFENQAKTTIKRMLLREKMINDSAEPIEEQEITIRLEPLRRAVQLVKRYRDVYCDKKDAEPVRSIVICTLMGEMQSKNDLKGSELDIVEDFCKYVSLRIKAAEGGPFIVKNPVVDEILTEKWTEDINNYRDFIEMVKNLYYDILKLKQATENIEISKILKEMFGEKITNQILIERADKINKARAAGTISVNAFGVLSTDGKGIEVAKNTFYGE